MSLPAPRDRLDDVTFEQPYCRIATLVEKDIAQRQAASRYLKDLVELGVHRKSPRRGDPHGQECACGDSQERHRPAGGDVKPRPPEQTEAPAVGLFCCWCWRCIRASCLQIAYKVLRNNKAPEAIRG